MTAAAPETALALGSLLRRGRAELEALYARSEPGPVPDGRSDGRATAAPGTALGRASESFFGLFWQGKVFDREGGRLVNRILGLAEAVPARVFVAESWRDGKPSIVIDYRGVSLLCRPVRDEIRRVGPGLYLGYAYVRTPVQPVAPLMFALDFSRAAR